MIGVKTMYVDKLNVRGLKIFLLALSLGACSTTELTSVWVDQENTRALRNILVVGISDNPEKQRLYEDTFVTLLQKQGIDAKAGYIEFRSNDVETTESVLAQLQTVNTEALLVTHALGVDNESVYHPPRMESVPHTYYDSFGGYYRTVYRYVHVPGYTSNHVVVRLETNLYDSGTQALLWSAQSKSVDPASLEKLISELAREVTSELGTAGFF